MSIGDKPIFNSHLSVWVARLASQALVFLKLHQSGTESTYIKHVHKCTYIQCIHMYIHSYLAHCLVLFLIHLRTYAHMYDIIVANTVNNAILHTIGITIILATYIRMHIFWCSTTIHTCACICIHVCM